MTGLASKALAPRELEYLRLRATGLTLAEIGQRMFIDQSTVKTHLRLAHRKLGARNGFHAIALAYERGLLTTSPGDPS